MCARPIRAWPGCRVDPAELIGRTRRLAAFDTLLGLDGPGVMAAKTTNAHADAGVESFELPGHGFYLAMLFQPQAGSSARGGLHPLLAALPTTLGGRGGDRDGVAAADRPRGHDVAPDAEVHAPPAA